MPDPERDNNLLIFLSHASEDKPAVRRLCKRLRVDGFDPWLDEERLLPGQDWSLEIEKALRASDVILLCLSSVSVAKEGYVQREYKRAMKYQEEKPEGAIFVIPVRLDECELPFFIRELQWVDYPADYDRLLLSLQSRSGGIAMPKKPATKSAARKTDKPKSSGGHTYNVQGGIHAARDVIMGDQTKTYYQTTQTLNVSTPTEFVAELKKLKEEIAALKSQPSTDPAAARRLTAVEGDIEDAITEARKETPVIERIKTTLDGAKETMDKLGGSVTSAVNLGTTLGNLALLVWKVFGG